MLHFLHSNANITNGHLLDMSVLDTTKPLVALGASNTLSLPSLLESDLQFVWMQPRVLGTD